MDERTASRRGGNAGWVPGLVGRSVMLLSAVLALHPAAVLAQAFAGDPVEGQRLAETWCSGCHQMKPLPPGGDGASGSDAGPPSFPAIARMPSTTALSLRVFLRTPHAPMPDLILTEAEIAHVSAFILALRELALGR